jgi:predicted ATPase
MKVARAIIENFRKVEKLELDFRDELGRVRDFTLIVGPNTSGKTTILDALAVSVGLGTELSYGRTGFTLSPPAIVRRGALNARVTCWVRFSPEEVAATEELFRLAEQSNSVPNVEEVSLTWEYPDPRKKSRYGFTHYDPPASWTLFKGRSKVAELLRTRRVDWKWFQRVGGVFTFDQQRTGLGKTIPRDIWHFIQGGLSDEGAGENADRRTADPRTILLSLAVQSKLKREGGQKNDLPDQFEFIQERYAEICAPNKLVGTAIDEIGTPDLIFSDGRYEYRYDGLSSGEQMLLLFLIRMVSEHIHQSLVFVDEIELHQHPIWQRKLLHLLPRIGKGNQLIATTHSPYLRDAAPPEAVIDLGDLL